MATTRSGVGPKAYLEDHPTQQTIRLCGRYINIARLATDQNLDHSYVSRILAGERNPSLDYFRRIADALMMGTDELIEGIRDRKEEVSQERQRQLGLET